MNINLYEFEKDLVTANNQITNSTPSDEEINKKYVDGEARVITENGSIKLPLLNGMFKTNNYILQPNYQRIYLYHPYFCMKQILVYIK